VKLSDDAHPLLQIRGATKYFPGVVALDRVDFTLRRGEIHTLMGENGAGKSTLVKVLTGVHPPDSGQFLLDGKPIAPRSPVEAQAAGISTVYQEVNLVPFLSVAENIFLARQPKRLGRIDWKQIHARSAAALRRLDLHIDVARSLSSYSIAIQQMVAIARALDVEAKILILDEPTSSLDTAEVAQLFAVMRRLREQGLGIVFISHFLDQVYAISDRFTVLRNGKLVGEYEATNLPRLELIAKMIGKDIAAVEQMDHQHGAGPAPAGDAPPVLVAEKVSRRGALGPTDLSIHRGEVVGLAGLLGSGRTELARLLFGVDGADGGSMTVQGRPVKLRSPRGAIRRGLGFVPEDRKNQSIMPNLSIRENIVVALQGRRGWWRPLTRGRQRALADRYIRALGIATPDAEKPIAQLSGGNQQKAILARWLALEPKLMILDEPTRGIDVGAKAEIEKLIGELRRDGMAILFISSELEEVVRVSHRVAVMRDRAKVGELCGEQIDVQHIMRAIAAGPTGGDARAVAHAAVH
jgi:simple sugar transport system ATP-binding protein